MYWLETAHDSFGWNVLFCAFVRTASVLSVGSSAVQLAHLPIAVERSIFPKAQMDNNGRLYPPWEGQGRVCSFKSIFLLHLAFLTLFGEDFCP